MLDKRDIRSVILGLIKVNRNRLGDQLQILDKLMSSIRCYANLYQKGMIWQIIIF